MISLECALEKLKLWCLFGLACLAVAIRAAASSGVCSSSGTASCQEIPAALQSFCLYGTQSNKLERYKTLQSTCSWKVDLTRKAIRQTFPSFESYSQRQLGSDGSLVVNNGSFFNIARCSYNVDSIRILVSERVGPIRSSSKSWHSFSWKRVVKMEYDKIQRFIQLSVNGAIDSLGDLVPYPPLEMHHLHLHTGSWDGNIYSQTHTDTQCARADDGIGCLVWDFPADFGILLSKDLNTEGVIVDVRRPGAGAFEFWVEVGLIVRTASVRFPVSTWMSANPFQAMNLKTFGTDTFTHAAARDTLFWHSSSIKHGGLLSPIKFHAHWEWTVQVQLFMAHPQQLGLFSALLLPEKPWLEIDLAARELSIADANSSIFNELENHSHEGFVRAPRLITSFSPKWEYVNFPYASGWYPRDSGNTLGVRVEKNDNLTLVSFHHPFNADAAGAGFVALHTAYIAYFVRDDNLSSFDYGKGSTDPLFAWSSLWGGHNPTDVILAGGGPYEPEIK